MAKKKRLHQLLQKKPSRRIPVIPKSYFLRPEVPPPSTFQGKIENATHYKYKIYLGETIRDTLSYLSMLEYDFRSLPDFFHARYDRYLSYLPDIYLKCVDDTSKTVYVSDIEINGLVHYKNQNQILKCIERKDHVYSYLKSFKEIGKEEDYKTVASYIVFDKDDFEYHHINWLLDIVKKTLEKGGVYPQDYDSVL